MKLLYLGDLVGRAGRTAAIESLPRLRRELDLDFVIVNGENAANGFGITPKICDQVYGAGADVIVLGNHAWDAREIIPHIDGEARLIRPLNLPDGTPGRGASVFEVPGGRRILIVQVLGRIFMDPLDDPFAAAAEALRSQTLGGSVNAIFVDMHAEATSEKMAIGHYLDGQVSCVFGTHTHVPTADHQILPGGTGYMSDVGMCGDYDSVIGMEKSEPVRRFTRKMPGARFAPATGEATVCGVYLEIDDNTGLTTYLAPLRQGGRLAPVWPLPDSR
ncbi:MAG: TIGR00282 family metallophosphoesterase [Alphaproteobacteria bacterium]|nr:TIGR00282 family metallophosphoesterase [Alphaproteobacteria bacterium]MDP6829617.1 TIGR00282 family metallophosphoesterase [Alphaproteobacteria bacterium]